MRPFLQSSLDRIYLLLGCRITRRKQCELEYLVGWILITQAAVLHAGIISSQMFQRWKQMSCNFRSVWSDYVSVIF